MPDVVLIRCDGSPAVGLGHVMRCRALAHALVASGAEVIFVIGSGSEGIEASLSTVFPAVRLASRGAAAAEGLDAEDLSATLEIARERGASRIMVDHYGASAAYLDGLASSGIRVGVIEDMADRDLRAADWVLNQNLGAEELPHRVRPGCRLLLGPAYALLRPQFAAARRGLLRRFEPGDRKVLVMLGGGDASQALRRVLPALEGVRRPLAIRCLLGGACGSEGSGSRSQSSRHSIESLAGVDEVAPHMAWADLSVNAGGSSCWELACLGVPMIVLVRAANQVHGAASLARSDCARNLGEWDESRTSALLAAAVEDLLSDPTRRAEMSRRAATLVDGRGADRAAEEILKRRTQR